MPVNIISTLQQINQGAILIFKSYPPPFFFLNFTGAESVYNVVLTPADSTVMYIDRYRTYRYKESFSDSFPLCVCVCTQSCSALCGPMDCSPPGSSAHGIPRYILSQNTQYSSLRYTVGPC